MSNVEELQDFEMEVRKVYPVALLMDITIFSPHISGDPIYVIFDGDGFMRENILSHGSYYKAVAWRQAYNETVKRVAKKLST